MNGSPERIRSILAGLDIPAELIEARSLVLHPEAEDLAIAEVGDDGREHRLIPAAAAAWRSMKAAALSDGVVIRLVSAFRSIDRQVEIVREKLAKGISLATILSASAPPGYSEHHTGRAIDVTTDGVDPLEVEFESTAAFRWLSKNAARFGFRLSYPHGNSHGYQYEPWHWFYQGRLRTAEVAGLRAVALFEALKGAIVLAAGFGLASLVHRDAQAAAEALVERLHLDPAKKYPHIFLDLAAHLSDGQLWALAALAMVYAALRFAEAYGLCFERRWGEWIAALSGAIYVPVEIYELSRGFSAVKLGALILNALVVGYMCHLLRRRAV